MKSNIPPLQPETFYHIYNRGINGENIFKTPENYTYFLSKYAKFIPEVADTYAYCLLKNHFHILVKTKPDFEIQEASAAKKEGQVRQPSACSSHIYLMATHRVLTKNTTVQEAFLKLRSEE
jgi:hypothetical protein